MHALFPNILVVPFNETMVAFCFLHPLVEVNLPFFIDDFHPNTKVILNQDAFISTLACSLCFSFSGLSNIVHELLRYCFVPITFASGFEFLKKVCGHIICSHVPPFVSHLLITS